MKKVSSRSYPFDQNDLCFLTINGGYTIISSQEISHIRDAMGKKDAFFDSSE